MLPSILNDSTSFWLDFAGSRLPEASKIKEKMNREISVFFNREKGSQYLFFCMPGSILGSVLEPGAAIRARFFCPNALNHRSWVNYVLPGRKKIPRFVFLHVGVHFGISFRARSCNSGSLFLSQCVKSQELSKVTGAMCM